MAYIQLFCAVCIVIYFFFVPSLCASDATVYTHSIYSGVINNKLLCYRPTTVIRSLYFSFETRTGWKVQLKNGGWIERELNVRGPNPTRRGTLELRLEFFSCWCIVCPLDTHERRNWKQNEMDRFFDFPLLSIKACRIRFSYFTCWSWCVPCRIDCSVWSVNQTKSCLPLLQTLLLMHT